MEKEFVNYEQALALKELGCDEPCYRFYYGDRLALALNLEHGDTNTKLQKLHPNYVAVPLKQQVFRWFREKYNMLANVYSNASGFQYEYHDTIGGTHRFSSGFTGDCEYSGAFTTYEKAENACIDKLIEIAKQQDNDNK
jgi:hypothetical protein